MKTEAPGRPALFLDRDGTLIEEVHFCADPSQVRLLPGVRERLAELVRAGFALIIITNQSGIGRGYFSREDFQRVQDEVLRQLAPVPITATYFDDSHPDRPSARRKPSPAMVLEAAAAHGLDLQRSWFVGDRTADIECGRNAGLRTILVETGYGRDHLECGADHTAADLAAAIRIIQQEATWQG